MFLEFLRLFFAVVNYDDPAGGGDSGGASDSGSAGSSEGGEGGADQGSASTETTAKETDAGSTDDLATYIGSKYVNPEQRPLKKFDRSQYTSKKQIDEFIRLTEGKLFLSDAQIAKIKEKEAAKQKKVEGGDGVSKGSEKGEGKTEVAGKEYEEFFKSVDITADEFKALPEKIQERLADTYVNGGEAGKKYSELESRHTSLMADIANLKKDPVIAARLEEKRTGKKYVADDLPAPTKKEIQTLLEHSEDPEQFAEALSEFMAAKAIDVLKIERGVLERTVQKEQNEQKALDVLQKIIEMEPRIGIKEKDLRNIVEGHSEYDKLFGEGGIIKMLEKKRYSPLQIATKGPEELLREFAATKGWDKEEKRELVKHGAKQFLKNLRDALNPDKAQTIDVTAKSQASKTTGLEEGFDAESLISEIVSGNSKRWNMLIKRAGERGDWTTSNRLNRIMDEAREQKKKAA